MMSKSTLASFALIASCLAACTSSTSPLPGPSDDGGGNDATVVPDGSAAPDSATDAPVVTHDSAADAPVTPGDAQADVSAPADSGQDSGLDASHD